MDLERWLHVVRLRFRSVFRRDRVEQELDEEMRYHLERRIEMETARGMPAEEARYAALRSMEGLEAHKEACRDARRVTSLASLPGDVRQAVRGLRKTPGFTTVAVLIASIGIGATTAVFSVVHSVLIKPLPYPSSDALVAVLHSAPGVGVEVALMSAAQYFTYRDENRVFEEIGLYANGSANITERAAPEQVQVVRVTDGTLRALGVPPLLGRWFSPADDSPGTPDTMILTYAYWMRRFGGDTSIVGRRVVVDGQATEVIGVMPPGFRFLNRDAELFLPLRLDRSRARLGMFNFLSIARMKPGVSVEQANADVARMLPIWLKSWPAPFGGNSRVFESARFAPTLRPLMQAVVGDIGGVLWLLMGTIGIVLAIACANVASLSLVRAEERHHELAVRAALGAGRARLARELLCESIVLGCISGVLGVALTKWALRLLVALAPASLPRVDEIGIDRTVLLFAVIVSLVSGVLFAVIPIARHAAPNIARILNGVGRGLSDSRGRHRTRNTLIVVQVALAVVLLVASGLMMRTFQALRTVNPGFTAPDSLQLVRVAIRPFQVSDPEHVVRMQHDIRDRIAAIPGVSAVSFTSSAPLERFNSADGVFVADRPYAEGRIPSARQFRFISPGYFHTIGTPLVAGRDLEWADLFDRRNVALVSENLARELWGNPAAAIGKRIRTAPVDDWREVVGVVGDIHDDGVHTRAPSIVYWPNLMNRFWGNPVEVQRTVTFVIRAGDAGDEALLAQVRRAVWAVNPDVPVAFVRTLDEVYARSFAQTAFTLVMLAIAAAMALALGIAGIYGVIAYAAAQRRREIGIRMALGARQGELRRRFVRDGLALAALGSVCGLVAASALTRIMQSQLFGVSTLDPATYAGVCLVLITAAALASYVPARRATSVAPMEALRND